MLSVLIEWFFLLPLNIIGEVRDFLYAGHKQFYFLFFCWTELTSWKRANECDHQNGYNFQYTHGMSSSGNLLCCHCSKYQLNDWICCTLWNFKTVLMVSFIVWPSVCELVFVRSILINISGVVPMLTKSMWSGWRMKICDTTIHWFLDFWMS